MLALVLLQLNRLEEAEKSAENALPLKQSASAKAHLILADIRGEMGDFNGRARELDAYLERHPKDRNHKFIEATRDLPRRLHPEKPAASNLAATSTGYRKRFL